MLSDNNLKDFKIIVLESPHDSLHNSKDAQYNFGKIVAARSDGYKNAYGELVFPYGPEDFVANHVAICKKVGSDLVPFISYKVVSQIACNKYNLTFPLLNTLKEYGDLKEKVSNKINSILSEGKNVGYIGGLTRSPSKENSLKNQKVMKDMLSMSFCMASRHFGIDEVLVTGAIPNSAYKYIGTLGFNIFDETPVVVKDLKGIEAYIQHLSQWSNEMLEKTSYVHHLWDERVHFQAYSKKEEKTVYLNENVA